MNLSNGHISKEERQRRLQIETTLKGSADKISKPPRYLTSTQKKIYKNIIQELEASNILSNLDVYILVSLCRAIDRVNYIEKLIDNDIDLISNKTLMSSKDKYTKDMYRCCNELCLSPHSRAKLSSINADHEANKQDPLLKILNMA